jgi:hypothetical protein
MYRYSLPTAVLDPPEEFLNEGIFCDSVRPLGSAAACNGGTFAGVMSRNMQFSSSRPAAAAAIAVLVAASPPSSAPAHAPATLEHA